MYCYYNFPLKISPTCILLYINTLVCTSPSGAFHTSEPISDSFKSTRQILYYNIVVLGKIFNPLASHFISPIRHDDRPNIIYDVCTEEGSGDCTAYYYISRKDNVSKEYT